MENYVRALGEALLSTAPSSAFPPQSHLCLPNSNFTYFRKKKESEEESLSFFPFVISDAGGKRNWEDEK